MTGMRAVAALRGPSVVRSPLLAAGAALILSLVTAGALLAPLIAPYDPAAQLDITKLKNALPSAAHWLGTDAYSRDLLSRALFGARASLTVALIATVLATIIGSCWGAMAAYAPPRIGDLLMSIVDLLRSLPRMLMLLAAAVLLGALSPANLGVLVGLCAWPTIARFTHTLTRALRASPFIEAAVALGVHDVRALLRHMLPQLRRPIAATAVLLLADTMALEAGLSFIGLGVRPPGASWGAMVQDALPFLASAWWVAAVPCTLIVLTVASATSLADRAADGR